MEMCFAMKNETSNSLNIFWNLRFEYFTILVRESWPYESQNWTRGMQSQLMFCAVKIMRSLLRLKLNLTSLFIL